MKDAVQSKIPKPNAVASNLAAAPLDQGGIKFGGSRRELDPMKVCKGSSECQETTRIAGLIGETPIDTSEGFISLKDLHDMRAAGRRLPYAFSHDPEQNLPILARILDVKFAGTLAEVVQVKTDRGITITGSAEYQHLLYDDSMAAAEQLCPGNRLRKIARWANEQRGDRRCLNHRATPNAPSGTSILSRWMWEQIRGRIPRGTDVHHVNGDRIDDRLSNFDLIAARFHRSKHSSGSNNPRFIAVSPAILRDVWDKIEALPKVTHLRKPKVTPTRWNKFIRENGLKGKVPFAGSPTNGGRIQGMPWVTFEEEMQALKAAANDTVTSIEHVSLEEAVPVFGILVEGPNNFGALSGGILHSVIVSTPTLASPSENILKPVHLLTGA